MRTSVCKYAKFLGRSEEIRLFFLKQCTERILKTALLSKKYSFENSIRLMKKLTYILTLGAFLTLVGVNLYAGNGDKTCKAKAAKPAVEAKKECSGSKCDMKKADAKTELNSDSPKSCCAKNGAKAINETPVAKPTEKKS